MYDLIIIGGGPAGYRAAERSSASGLSTLLFEKRALGGVCLNEGCVPSKTLLYSAKLFDYAKGGSAKYGVTCDNAKLDHAVVVARKNKVVKKLTLGIAAQLKAGGVTVVSADAAIVGRVDGGYKVSADGTEYEAARLLIATGSAPALPPIEGLKESLASGFAWTNREVLDTKVVPQKFVIVGGGVIGLEMASYFRSAGAEVTVVEMLDSVGGPIDREIASLLQKAYEKKGVKFLLKTSAVKFAQGEVTVKSADGGEAQVIKCDNALVSIGRRAALPEGIEKLGVALERGAIVTDEYMRTSALNVWAAGDVNGKSMLAHTAYREAEVAVNDMAGAADTMDYSAIPAVIYTNPEVAVCGDQGNALDPSLPSGKIVKKVSMNHSGRFMAENEGGDGTFKMVLDGAGKILGVSIIGNPASEIIFGASLMLGRELRSADLRKIVFPHPTVSEIFRETIFQ
ncbi:MAG: dihydrolipoyl dehydrogenase [Oscillospiraceae bacterium]|jgi:dihydrolipoamide dehydrogenase|nr:dihydrolipoyl dehydrogenase [Oscillospiraceae bacterium]